MRSAERAAWRPTRRLATITALLVLATGAPLPGYATDPPQPVTVATVQFEVRRELYRSPDRFQRAVEPLVEEAAGRGADLVVFPEYINVFLVASRYPGILEHADSVSGALAALASRAGHPDLQALFSANAGWLSREVRRIWSSLAREHELTIVAGTTFEAAGGTPVPRTASDSETRRTRATTPGSDSPIADQAREDGPTLYNRALVFGEDGELVHVHEKAYLTPMEEDELGLTAGRARAATLFDVDGVEMGITICRDTYFESWHGPLRGLDLWIDLRANGEPYSREVYERFLGTLPERVRESSAVAGVNSSLTGTFWEMLWEGPSYVVDAGGRRVAQTPDVRGTRVLLMELTPNELEDSWRLAGAIPSTNHPDRSR